MQEYSNIFIPSLVNLGDVVLTTAAVALLKKKYPQAKITMMVRPMAGEVLQNNPLIDEVIIYDYKGKDKPAGKVLSLVKRLRANKFDLCICFDRKLRTSILSFIAGIPVRVGADKVFDDKPSLTTKLYTHVIRIPHDIINTHQVETYQAVVRGFTGIHDSMKPLLGKVMPKHEEKAGKLLATLPKSQIKIALCVKGTFALKNWPTQRFAETVEGLALEHDAAFFIIGAPEDKGHAEEVIAKSKVPIANFCGQTGLMDLAALLQKTDLFITVDTGATHIGAAIGVPMVVIYGCTSPKRWHPVSDKAVVLTTNEFCCPCNVPEDGCPEHGCMNKISVDLVLEKIKMALSL